MEKKKEEKILYIISGCNGAGKTTASFTVLPDILNCYEFVNADEIAKGLSPFNPKSTAIEAGRLMLLRIEELLKKEKTFSIETTLASKSYINLVRRAHLKGYQVRLIFFWLNSPELAILRVAQRVNEGGHDVSSQTIKRRYTAGITNLFNLYLNEVDYWAIFDNSSNPRQKIASGKKNNYITIFDQKRFKKIKEHVR